jgi:hypothetical protein
MTLEQAIYEALTDHAGTAALVDDRVYPVEAPQASLLPRIVFARQETQNLASMAGRGTHDSVQVAVMCFADDAAEARAVANAARDALDGLRGTAYTDAIQHCRLIGRTQARVAQAEADPGIMADGLLFSILAAET